MTTKEFIIILSELFTLYTSKKQDENTLVDAIQHWFFSLPKYTKITPTLYLGTQEFTQLDEEILKLKNYLRRPEIDAKKFLFEDIPELFNDSDLETLTGKIADTKTKIENVLPTMLENLENDVCAIFRCESRETLWQGLATWYDRLTADVKHHCFDEGEERLFKVILNESGSVSDLCFSLTGLMPEDFEESTPLLFIKTLLEHKYVIERYGKIVQDNKTNMYSILLGDNTIKTFKKVNNVSETGNILLHELTTVIGEYGHLIRLDEKRQILFNVLNSLGNQNKEMRNDIL